MPAKVRFISTAEINLRFFDSLMSTLVNVVLHLELNIKFNVNTARNKSPQLKVDTRCTEANTSFIFGRTGLEFLHIPNFLIIIIIIMKQEQLQ